MVSVIIPTYNREKTIERAINSVLKQTYENIEIIVVDDASTDNTESVVRTISDPRLKYIKVEKNRGACNARNVGIDNAKGEYIAFQDSDDVWHSDKISTQLDKMRKMNADVSFCALNKYISGSENAIVYPCELKEGFVARETLMTKSYASTQCVMCRKRCFEKVIFDVNMPRLQDWDLIIGLTEYFDILFIEDVLVDMYVQKDSISKNPKKGIAAMDKLIEKNEAYLKEHPAVYRNWLITKGNYKLISNENPKAEYHQAMTIKFDWSVFIKYVLSSLGIVNSVYRKRRRK